MSSNRLSGAKNSRNGNQPNHLRRKKKSFIPTLFFRFAMISVLLVGTSLICCTALTNISRPYVLGAQQSAQIASETKQLQELNTDNAKLSQQCAYLVRPDGIEYEARLKGYLKPGERSLILMNPTNTGN